ncbi:hypothetical protein C1646_768167 [Rhizophagus diaphanus]|nr:hypothetical protein C1646_768167 [Rhizophagus diaphanus] [Rhizophagus sp. MUCL 43196]
MPIWMVPCCRSTYWNELILTISSFDYFVGLFDFWSASFVLFSSSDMQYIRGSGIGLKCDWAPISKAQDAHLETLTFTSALNSENLDQNFFLWIYSAKL